jgi:hypothetical protein
LDQPKDFGRIGRDERQLGLLSELIVYESEHPRHSTNLLRFKRCYGVIGTLLKERQVH